MKKTIIPVLIVASVVNLFGMIGQSTAQAAVVPDVVGWEEADAVDAVISAGLTVTCVHQDSETVPQGYVISQDPGAETTVPPSSLVSLTISLGPEMVVDIPDRHLDAAIREALGIGNRKPLTNVDLASLTELDEQNTEIADLTGLEYCVELTYLRLTYGDINDISPLAGLTSLENLRLWHTNISDISSLAGLRNLESLRLYSNNISDISPLAGLTNLDDLWLSSNNISDISPLAGLCNLRTLNLGYNELGHIPPLPGLRNLRWLSLNDCNLTDISGLAGLANLSNLTLSYNNISDISPLSGLTNLWLLNLYSNNISDISPLAGLRNLYALNLHRNNISDISPLARLTNLHSLGIFDNNISDISPLVGLTNLWSLHLTQNPLNCDAYLIVIPLLPNMPSGNLSYDPMPPGCETTVSTLPATNVTKSSATLNGILTDDGSEVCQYRFRYMEGEGSYIYTPWSGSVTAGQSFSDTISDLEPSKIYYFNAQAKNSRGECEWGDEQSFSTALLPIVSTLPATNATKSSAELNGILTDDGDEACQYRFCYREENGDYIYTPWSGSVTTGQSFSDTISDLEPTKIYYFNAQARNSAGESDWGNEQSFVSDSLYFEITRARMVSPNELGIDINIRFPKDAIEEAPRMIDFEAKVNGTDVHVTCNITSITRPGGTHQIRWDGSFNQGNTSSPPPTVINFDSEEVSEEGKVPRFQDNVSFTLSGKAYWEGGQYSDESSTLVEIPLPVIIIHGYMYTYKAGGWFIEQIADAVAYSDLKKFLRDHGYKRPDEALYTTMWGMPDIMYRADRLTESDLYFEVDDWVTNALQASYADKVNLIGHSTGGLVARYYAGIAPTINAEERVYKVISVGTPHLGLTDFYALAFAEPTREKAEEILTVPGTNLENLMLWFEPQYPEGSCLVDADTGERMPEPYESTFNPILNDDVLYYSICAFNRPTPHHLWVKQRKNGWYKVVDPPEDPPEEFPTTSDGDSYVRVVSSSAGGGPILISGPNKNSPEKHGTLCKDPMVQWTILELLRE